MKKNYKLSAKQIRCYGAYLREQERADSTVQKYLHDLAALLAYLRGRALTKAVLLEWKGDLAGRYAPASVNTMLAAVNGFLRFMGWGELTVRFLKIQKALFCDERRELTRADYVRLVNTARRKRKERLSLVLQTICATGIRVSELREMKSYLKRNGITAGPVFVTRSGRPLDRSNIWRDMKVLCKSAGVKPDKVFPHNLRHLFARTFYTQEKDLSRLADILGHTSVNTTRIYTAESGLIHARQMERMGLIVT